MSSRIWLGACGSLLLCAAWAAEDLKDHMVEHFAAATQVQTAVINANLEAASERAHWLANHPIARDIPAGALKSLARMRLYARGVGEAQSVTEAAMSTAQMAAACGNCHTETGTETWLGSDTPTPMGDTLGERMARHLWAADRLWEGLIAPSDESWMKGAEGLMEAPLTAADLGQDQDPAIENMGQAIRALADRARVAPEEGRALIYGEFLARCAACHQRYRNR